LAPVPYDPPTMIHMEKLQRRTIGLECIVARLPGGRAANAAGPAWRLSPRASDPNRDRL
jgi:hypothetical protein